MTVSQFLRYMDLKDEWEALAPERDRYLYWTTGFFVLGFASWIAMILSVSWAPFVFLPALVGFWVVQWKYMNRSRACADLLAEMRGLAYDPH